MELLDNKHVQSLGGHLARLIKGLSEVHANTLELLAGPSLFPVEVDLSNSAFQYKSTTPIVPDAEEEDQEIENGEEVQEIQEESLISGLSTPPLEMPTIESTQEQLIPGLENISSEPDYSCMDNLTLLASLNIQENYENSESTDLLIPGLEKKHI